MNKKSILRAICLCFGSFITSYGLQFTHTNVLSGYYQAVNGLMLTSHDLRHGKYPAFGVHVDSNNRTYLFGYTQIGTSGFYPGGNYYYQSGLLAYTAHDYNFTVGARYRLYEGDGEIPNTISQTTPHPPQPHEIQVAISEDSGFPYMMVAYPRWWHWTVRSGPGTGSSAAWQGLYGRFINTDTGAEANPFWPQTHGWTNTYPVNLTGVIGWDADGNYNFDPQKLGSNFRVAISKALSEGGQPMIWSVYIRVDEGGGTEQMIDRMIVRRGVNNDNPHIKRYDLRSYNRNIGNIYCDRWHRPFSKICVETAGDRAHIATVMYGSDLSPANTTILGYSRVTFHAMEISEAFLPGESAVNTPIDLELVGCPDTTTEYPIIAYWNYNAGTSALELRLRIRADNTQGWNYALQDCNRVNIPWTPNASFPCKMSLLKLVPEGWPSSRGYLFIVWQPYAADAATMPNRIFVAYCSYNVEKVGSSAVLSTGPKIIQELDADVPRDLRALQKAFITRNPTTKKYLLKIFYETNPSEVRCATANISDDLLSNLPGTPP